LAVDWFKCDGENGKVGDVSKLTKWSHAGMAAATAESLKFTAAIFHRPAAAALIPLPPPADAVNWLGN
jgi:hypothetical protein